MGPNLYIFVHDSECAEQVLKGRTTLNKPKVYEAISDVLGGAGLFSSNGNIFFSFDSRTISADSLTLNLLLLYLKVKSGNCIES